jgi:hypothetical protein
MVMTDWETRYKTGDMPWEKGEASPGLVDFLARHGDLARGMVCACRVAEPGMTRGNGRGRVLR